MHHTSLPPRVRGLVGTTAVLAAAATVLAPVVGATAVPTAADAPTTSVTAAAKAKAQPTGYARLDEVEVFLRDVPGNITGKIGAPRQRLVKLQAKKGRDWDTIATTNTRADGSFTFTKVTFKSTTTIRVDAPAASFIGNKTVAQVKKVAKEKQATAERAKKKWKKAKKALDAAKKSGNKKRIKKARKAYTKAAGTKLRTAGAAKNAVKQAKKKPYVAPWSVSPEVTVEVAAQHSVDIAMLPEISQPGTTAAEPGDGTIASVRSYPGRSGRTVTLQVSEKGTWSNAGTARTDELGNAVFPVEVGRTYRATVEAGSGLPAGTTVDRTVPSFRVDFEDTFTDVHPGTGLDPAKWRSADRGLDNGLRSCAIANDSVVKVSDGVLTMGVKKDPSRLGQTCTFKDSKGTHQLPYMVNTQIDTSKTYTFTHGIAAARMKVQSAVGMHSAFWSHPNNNLVANDPARGAEIDAMEYFGDDYHEKGIAAFIHHNVNGTVVKEGQVFQKTPSLISDSSTNMSERFAVYSVEWTPSAYIFRLDGREFHRVSRYVSQVPQFLALSLLTSSWELVNLTDFDSTAEVDWVRVWKR